MRLQSFLVIFPNLSTVGKCFSQWFWFVLAWGKLILNHSHYLSGNQILQEISMKVNVLQVFPVSLLRFAMRSQISVNSRAHMTNNGIFDLATKYLICILGKETGWFYSQLSRNKTNNDVWTPSVKKSTESIIKYFTENFNSNLQNLQTLQIYGHFSKQIKIIQIA